jgi:D-serine dehydratase
MTSADRVRAFGLDEPLDERFRSLPTDPDLLARAATVGDVAGAGWHLDDLLLPTLTLRAPALRHNGRLVADWCATHGAVLAPHGKTSMSPQLVAQQLDDGAWAVTAATVGQARLMRRWGVPRVLLANQVTDRAGLAWLDRTLRSDPDLELLVLADSPAGVRLMEHLGTPERPLAVLLELGVAGGRTGARTAEEALAVAHAVGAAPGLRLAGVECFEGVHPSDRSETATAAVRAMVDELGRLLVRLDAEGLLRDEAVITAGGSAYPDLVVAGWESLPELSVPVRRVVRSGGSLFHDHGMLARSSPWPDLRPALEVHAAVLSVPEPGLSIVGFGKRDASSDIDLPVPLDVGATVVALNDQHAFVRHGEKAPWRVGDRARFGISHPCTTLDRWPLVPVLDDEDAVVGAVRTYF